MGRESSMDDIRLAMIGTALDFIETHLEDGVALADVAQAAHYSKYHLHRAFSGILGITPHQYARRRRLTEAARRLVRFQTPLRDLALMAGYQSQQAFSDAFCAMYKIPPAEYRRLRVFYPLQLPIRLNPETPLSAIRPAQAEDIPAWMALLGQVVDGYPRLDEAGHLSWLKARIARGEALLLSSGDRAAGAVGFCRATGMVDYLAVHPQYRALGISVQLLKAVRRRLSSERELSLTTFRERDPADPGYRREWKRLNFREGELLVEFGYPTQRMIWSVRDR